MMIKVVDMGKRVFCYNMTFVFRLKDFESRKVMLEGKEYVICKPADETALVLIPPEMFSDVEICEVVDG